MIITHPIIILMRPDAWHCKITARKIRLSRNRYVLETRDGRVNHRNNYALAQIPHINKSTTQLILSGFIFTYRGNDLIAPFLETSRFIQFLNGKSNEWIRLDDILVYFVGVCVCFFSSVLSHSNLRVCEQKHPNKNKCSHLCRTFTVHFIQFRRQNVSEKWHLYNFITDGSWKQLIYSKKFAIPHDFLSIFAEV